MLESLLDIFVNYGPYVGLALGINAIMVGLKTKLFPKFFRDGWGSRFLWIIPLLFGMLGGLLVGETVKSGMLTGLGLGAVSHYFYKFFTKTLGLKNESSKENLDLDKS